MTSPEPAASPPPSNVPPPFPVDECRSCGAKVIWAFTSRKRMPVDAACTSGGTVLLEWSSGAPFAKVIPAVKAFGRKDLRTSHFATCPNADDWRTKKARPAGRGHSLDQGVIGEAGS